MKWVQLDVSEVRRGIQLGDLKMWWVAEQIGVHKTTLRRWLSGRIKTVSSDHFECLSALLHRESGFQNGELRLARTM